MQTDARRLADACGARIARPWSVTVAERHSEYARDEHDWYVEPSWCVDALLHHVPALASEGLHDPCCGGGTIPFAAAAAFVGPATGADLVDRANGRFPVQNFMTDNRVYPNIVTNPPFKIAPAIVAHALRRTTGRVCIIAQAKFLFSQARHPLFTRPEMERVLIFSRRPSMPPGTMLAEQGEACRGGGAIDYCWCIWRVGKTGHGCAIEWVSP